MIDEIELVRRAARGDSRAFEQLLAAHYRGVYAIALAHVRTPQDAEDLCQEVLIKCWQRLDQCGNPGAFRAWLWAMARNAARNRIDYLRVRQVEPLENHPELQTAETVTDVSGERARLNAALDRLAPLEREVLLLFDMEDYSHSEIAELVGVSEAMSRRHLFNARRAMRAFLGGSRESEK